jgi:allantoate deiminase
MHGDARHCATPWDLRRDSLVGAAEAISAIERIGKERNTPVTVGHIRVEPDAVNVIPGLTEFSLDIRDSDDGSRDATLAVILDEIERLAAARSLTVDVRHTHEATATHCSPRLMNAVADGIRSTGDENPRELFSVAGHDAMAVAEATDVAMLFVRCKGGISHSPEESVRTDDVAVALDAFHAAVLALAAE